MGFWSNLLSNVPLEFLFPPRDRRKALEGLAKSLSKPPQSPPEMPTPVAAAERKEVTDVSDQQTLIYQLELIRDDLEHLEQEHLPNKGRIAGAPCDCLAKAGRSLRRHARETIPIAARQGQDAKIYSEFTSWADHMIEIGTIEDVSSGKYDEEYLREAGTGSRYRKQIDSMLAELKQAQATVRPSKEGGEETCPECATLEDLRSYLAKRKQE